MYFENKNILVCGGARSGISVVKLLQKYKGKITIYDENKIKIDDDLKNKVTIIIGSEEKVLKLIEKQDILIVSPGIPLDKKYIILAKEKNIPVISEVEVANNFTNNTIIGITGTNGKTTTATLISEVLNAKGFDTRGELVGNIGIPFTEKVLDVKKEDIFIAELSSYQLESTKNLKPKVSLVLNISKDHLERHRTVENYIKIKMNIFKNMDKDDFLVLNYDDYYCRYMIDKVVDAKIIYFSKKCIMEKGVFIENDTVYSTVYNKKVKILELSKIQLVGEHNIENILASIATLQCLKIGPDQLKKGIYGFKGVEHRLEFIKTIKGLVFINDAKATNEQATINAIKSFEKGIILILGGQKKESIDFTLINLIKKNVQSVILYGENSNILKKCLEDIDYTNIIKANSMIDVISKVLKLGLPGDIILFSPGYKSFDMYYDYEERGIDFKNAVNKIIEKE